MPDTKRNILLVDDDSINLMVSTNLIKKLGHTVKTAENGQEAVDLIEEETFDLVFMDIEMPVMDGFTAAGHVREKEKVSGAHTPIVAMTASEIEGGQERCLEAGLDGFVLKPINAGELPAIIEKYTSNVEKPQLSEEKAGQQEGPVPGESLVAPINIEEALDRAIGDKPLLKMILEEFLKNLLVQVDSLRGSSEMKDSEALWQIAHGVKGSAANIYAEKIRAIASNLELMGKSGNLSEADELIDALEKEHKKLKEYIGGIEWLSD